MPNGSMHRIYLIVFLFSLILSSKDNTACMDGGNC
jgi:hypothetical protein